jgi:hypothetical protein
MTINMEKLIDGLRAYAETDKFKELCDGLKTGGILSKFAGVIPIATEAVHVVEKIAADVEGAGISGSEKREAVVTFLDGVLILPVWLEPFDGPLIGKVVDGVVAFYNTKIGHKWLDKVKSIFS